MKETTVQLNHLEIENSKPHGKDIVVIAENFIQVPSYGMFVRTAEAFGAQKVVFISDVIFELTPKMKRRSCATEKYIPVEFNQDIVAVLTALKEDGYTIIALERTNNSVPIHQFKTDSDKLVLIAGSERFGVTKEALALCDASLEIEMYGVNSSMNVLVASGIALQQLIHHS